MSLLIKALDQAEKAQEEQQQVQQALRRRASNIANHASGEVDLAQAEMTALSELQNDAPTSYHAHHDNAAVQAANVFEAKQPMKKPINPMLWFVAFGVLALMAIGFYFYYQLNHLQAPVLVTPVIAASNLPVTPSAAAPAAATLVANSQLQTTPTNQTAIAQAASQPSPTATALVSPQVASANQASTQPKQVAVVSNQKSSEKSSAANDATAVPVQVAEVSPSPKIQVFRSAAPTDSTSNSLTARESVVSTTQAKAVKRGSHLNFGQTIASDSVSIQVSKSKTQLGINPELTRAYDAYVAGNDSEAQTLYKRVLQRDVRNVDALLGMGAIAERQGRLPDALGWYQKVLEVEPRNATALTAYYAQTEDKQDKELKLKNLIANTPNSPNVYADLADYYAENNQWPEAQQAYFEAYRLNKSAENAFNLAVSLDQLGKPAIALPYYQEALALAASAANNNIDEAALQKRIAAIQAN